MQDVQDEPLFCERVAGLDIAKAGVEVTIRVPSDTTPGRRQQETRTFGTTRRELESLGDWLRSWGVTRAGMEATSAIRGINSSNRTHPGRALADASVTVASVLPMSGLLLGSSFLLLAAEPPTQHEVLAVRGLQGSLQLGDLLAVMAPELGELAGERCDDAAGLFAGRRAQDGCGARMGTGLLDSLPDGGRCGRGSPATPGRQRPGRGR
jgi:hypothetical protein